MNRVPVRPRPKARLVRNLVIAGAALDAILVCLSVARYPRAITAATDGALGLIGPLAILLTYAAIGWFGAPATARRTTGAVELRLGTAFGGLIGALFVIEMLAGYLAPLNEGQNATLGTVMYGGFALLLVMAGIAGGWQTRRVTGGGLAAAWGAVLGSLLWLAALWLTFHVFWGTPQEARQFVVDQVIADFQRSGGTDLRAFVIQDNLGGSFFHLLLGLLLASLLGLFGGAAGVGLARVFSRRGNDAGRNQTQPAEGDTVTRE